MRGTKNDGPFPVKREAGRYFAEVFWSYILLNVYKYQLTESGESKPHVSICLLTSVSSPRKQKFDNHKEKTFASLEQSLTIFLPADCSSN